jgi:hypothetical protein
MAQFLLFYHNDSTQPRDYPDLDEDE